MVRNHHCICNNSSIISIWGERLIWKRLWGHGKANLRRFLKIVCYLFISAIIPAIFSAREFFLRLISQKSFPINSSGVSRIERSLPQRSIMTEKRSWHEKSSCTAGTPSWTTISPDINLILLLQSVLYAFESFAFKISRLMLSQIFRIISRFASKKIFSGTISGKKAFVTSVFS